MSSFSEKGLLGELEQLVLLAVQRLEGEAHAPAIREAITDRTGIDLARGTVYVNSEDGNLYAISQGGTLRDRLFLQNALRAAYTPLSLGADGKIYTQNAGHLFAVGSNAPRRRAVGK